MDEQPHLVNASVLRTITGYSWTLEAAQIVAIAQRLPTHLEGPWLANNASAEAIDLEKALELLDAIPSGEDHVKVAVDIAMKWYSADLDAAVSWIEGMQHIQSRDAAFASVAWRLRGDDADRAFAIAQNIDEEEARLDSIDSMFTRWRNEDRAKALSWIETTEILTPALRNRLLSSSAR